METESQTTSSPIEASTSFKVPAGIPKLGKMIPTVLLKSVFAPAGGYQCELCSQNFINASQLVKHKQLHEEERPFTSEVCERLFTSQEDFTEHQHDQEPSFPCNMCDRSFTSSHNLKRHKLLHVKDGRKCHKCGVLFCRLHNHVVFLPQTKSELESSMVESLLEEEEPNQFSDSDDDDQNTMTITQMQTTTAQPTSPTPPKPGPLTKIHNPLPPASHTRIIKEIPVPTLKKPSPHPPRNSRKYYPANLVRPCPPAKIELPPSLRVFSPQYLTSALLEVERNYEYILDKARDVKNNLDIVKEEPCELPLDSPDEQSAVGPNRKERIAYDLEVVLWSKQMYHFLKQTVNESFILFYCNLTVLLASAVMYHLTGPFLKHIGLFSRYYN